MPQNSPIFAAGVPTGPETVYVASNSHANMNGFAPSILLGVSFFPTTRWALNLYAGATRVSGNSIVSFVDLTGQTAAVTTSTTLASIIKTSLVKIVPVIGVGVAFRLTNRLNMYADARFIGTAKNDSQVKYKSGFRVGTGFQLAF
jgi:hypothetical protein